MRSFFRQDQGVRSGISSEVVLVSAGRASSCGNCRGQGGNKDLKVVSEIRMRSWFKELYLDQWP